MRLFRWFLYANGAGIAVFLLVEHFLGDEYSEDAAMWTCIVVFFVGVVRWLWLRRKVDNQGK